MNKELEELKKIEEIKKEFTDILVEFGKVVEDVAIAGVRNLVGFKPTHLWEPAYDRAIERLLETIPSHDEIKREAVESIKEEVKGMKTGHSSYSCKPNICVCGADEDRWNLAIDEVLTY